MDVKDAQVPCVPVFYARLRLSGKREGLTHIPEDGCELEARLGQVPANIAQKVGPGFDALVCLTLPLDAVLDGTDPKDPGYLVLASLPCSERGCYRLAIAVREGIELRLKRPFAKRFPLAAVVLRSFKLEVEERTRESLLRDAARRTAASTVGHLPKAA